MFPMQSPVLGRDMAEQGFGGLRGLFRQRPHAQTGGGMQPRPFPHAMTGGGMQPMPIPQATTGGGLPPQAMGLPPQAMTGGDDPAQPMLRPMTGGGLPAMQGLPGLFVRTGGGFQPRQVQSSYAPFGMDWGRLMGGRSF